MYRSMRAGLVMAVLVGLPSTGTAAAAFVTGRAATDAVSSTATVDEMLLPIALGALTLALAWLSAAAVAGCVVASRDLTTPTVGRRQGPACRMAVNRRPAPTGVTAAVALMVLVLSGAGTASASAPQVAVTAPWAAGSAAPDMTTADVNPPQTWFVDSPVAGQGPDSGRAVAGWTPPVPTAPVAVSRLVVGAPGATGHVVTEGVGHVVVRGDSLWSIAADHLGPDATAVEVSQHWPRWWQANHTVIGDDPDLILPGQSLRPPT